MLTAAFREALLYLPAPVVSVQEINDINSRVSVLESLTQLAGILVKEC